MDDINNKLEFKGRTGKQYTFVHCYELAKDTVPGSEGIYVFTKSNGSKSHTVLDVQLLLNKDEIDDTVERLKEDGATYAFFKECDEELNCDAQIDDIKGGDDYKNQVD